jgi:hypothetical protein
MKNAIAQSAFSGISNDFSFRRLAYNPVACVLLVEAETARDGYPVHRIFQRHKDASMYELIQEPGARISHCSVVACNSAPCAYFLVYEVVGSNRPCGTNWVGIARLDFISGGITLLLKRGELKLAHGAKDAWLVEIINCLPNGSDLYCIAAIRSADGSEIKYLLSQLNLETKVVNPIAELKACVF